MKKNKLISFYSENEQVNKKTLQEEALLVITIWISCKSINQRNLCTVYGAFFL